LVSTWDQALAIQGGILGIVEAEYHARSERRSRSPVWLRVFLVGFLIVFVVSGLYAGYLFYGAVRDLVAQIELPAVPAFQLSSLGRSQAAGQEDPAEPLPQVSILTPEAGTESALAMPAYVPPPAALVDNDRINILLLGIDTRGKENWDQRTDTIIIVTVDPANKTAGMLSIPRDLQLPIPGNGEDRINTANVWGETKGYPGGGPALLERTIEVNFHQTIDYYVMVDFKAFEKIIDTLGGIDVDVPKTLHDTKYPDPRPGDPYAYKTIHFDPGPQHMDGARALEYARSRMSTTDFDRAGRQQLILLAIREKALGLNLIPKLPALAATMLDSIKTDMTIAEMKELALLAPQIDMENIKRVVLQKPLIYAYRREDGAAVQLPKWDLIDPILEDLFHTPVVPVAPTATPAAPTPTPTLAPAQIEELQELAQEGARIAVQNGTLEPNYAARVAAMLIERGYQVVEFGDADRLDYPNTVIVDYTGKTYTLERLVDEFQVTPENVRHSPNLRSPFDIRVIVGEDFRLSLP
jgi:LCP family protein required for cell wall assembly